MERKCPLAGAAAILLMTGTFTLAGDAALIESRIARFREIGTAFKQVKDELKSKQPDLARIRQAARLIKNRGADMPRWFPRGSEPAAHADKNGFDRIRAWFGFGDSIALPDEVKSNAKMAVWTEPAQFKAAHDQFTLEADQLWQAAQTGEPQAIAARLQALGKACASCHEKFREKED